MKKILIIIPLVILLIIGASAGFYWYKNLRTTENFIGTIKVGILHSQTGYKAPNEKPIIEATLLAIDEVNAAGGVLGKKIVPIIADAKSSPDTFAAQAENLLNSEKVEVIFGCWTPTSRRTVEPVLAKYQGLLFYPGQAEGVDLSPHVISLGPTPNQQVIPGVQWGYENLGKKFYLIGSDYLYSHVAQEIMKEFIPSLPGAEIVGEAYIPLGTPTVKEYISKIIESKPDVILNTINGETSKIFFKELRRAGITPEHLPTISFSLTRIELNEMNPQLTLYDYAVWGYFQSIDNEKNNNFVRNFKKKYGEDRVLNSPMQDAYNGVHIWKLAVEKAKGTSLNSVREAIKNLAFNAPEGIIHIDSETQYAWKFTRVGKIRLNSFSTLWESQKATRPEVYLTMFKTKTEWDEFVNSLYVGWGNKWENRIKS